MRKVGRSIGLSDRLVGETKRKEMLRDCLVCGLSNKVNDNITEIEETLKKHWVSVCFVLL